MERLHRLIARPVQVASARCFPLRVLSVGPSPRAHGNQAVDMWVEKRVNRDAFSDFEDLRQRRYQEGTQRTPGLAASGDPEQVAATREMRLLSRERRWQEALQVYSNFTHPDCQLSTTAMDACAKSMQLEPARHIFDTMPSKSVPSYNVLINLLGRLRRVDEAESLLHRMRQETLEPSSITMTSLIAGYGMVRDSAAAVRVLEEMEGTGLDTGAVTYGATLTACARAGDLARCEQLLQRMEKQQVQVGSAHLVSIVSACARDKNEARAKEAFQEIRARGFKPDKIAYTCLINCLSGEGAMRQADALLAEMQAEGIRPDGFVYGALLSAAISSRVPQRFQDILADMEARGIRPTAETRVRCSEMAVVEEQLREERAQWEAATSQASAASMLPEAPRGATPGVAPLPPLPAGWHEHVDPASGRAYYWMGSDPAGTTTWERPS